MREEKLEKVLLRERKKQIINDEQGWNELHKKGKDKKSMDKIFQLYKLDKKDCKNTVNSYDDFLKCMTKKGYREKFIQRFY